MESNRPRLAFAMICFVVLALLAGLTLEGLFRIAVWVFLGGLAARTWIAAVARKP